MGSRDLDYERLPIDYLHFFLCLYDCTGPQRSHKLLKLLHFIEKKGKNHEFLMNLFWPGGVRLKATGSSKKIPEPIPGQGPPPIQSVTESPGSSLNPSPQDEIPAISANTPERPPLPDPPPPLPLIEEPPVVTYKAPAPD